VLSFFNWRFAMFAMTEPKTVVHIQVDNSRALIESASVPLGDAVTKRIEAVIESEARDVTAAIVSSIHAEFYAASAATDMAHKALADDEARLARSEADRAGHPGGSAFLSALFGLCAAACLSAEFTLTLVTLPFILGIRQWSYLGITLALAPATAVIILDKVFARLVEDPWRAFRNDTAKRTRRVSSIAVMVLFLACLGAGNIYTVITLADAREHATELRRALESGNDAQLTPEKLAVHRAAIKVAILAVSVFVTLDGACFSLFALLEFRQVRAASTASRLVDRLRAKRDADRDAARKADAELARTERRLEIANELGAIEADRYRSERFFRLAEARMRSAAPRSNADLVMSILTRRAANGSRQIAGA
jgi:hypothetical protein